MKFHKITSLVPQLCKINKNGPWDIKTLRKSTFVLVLLIFGRNGPWLGSLVKLHVWSLKFTSLADLVLGGSKVENSTYNPCTIKPWKVLHLQVLLESCQTQPSKIQKLKNWSLY